MPIEETRPKPEATTRERFQQRRATGKKTGPTPRNPSPVRPIEPGPIHQQIANGILREVRDRAATKGIDLDIGELPSATGTGGENDDPEQLAKVTAHAVARVGDRFSFVRKLSRHMEGNERRAGILSDVAAALYTLYRRNPDLMEHLAKSVVSDVKVRQAQRTNQSPKGGIIE